MLKVSNIKEQSKTDEHGNREVVSDNQDPLGLKIMNLQWTNMGSFVIFFAACNYPDQSCPWLMLLRGADWKKIGDDLGILGKRGNWTIAKLSVDTILKPFVKYVLIANDVISKIENQQPYATLVGTAIH